MSAFEADRFNHSRTSPRRTNFLFVQPNAFYQVEYRAFAGDWRDKSCSVLLHDHGVNKIKHVGAAALGCPHIGESSVDGKLSAACSYLVGGGNPWAIYVVNHSRRTRAGSVLVARRAGRNTAANEITVISVKAKTKAKGSRGLTL
jgi:hypothetical protein